MMAISRGMAGGEQTWYGIAVFWALWVLLGTTICTGLTRLANRLQVLSWRPARQVLAGVAGALLGTAAFCVLTVPFVLATSEEADTASGLVSVALVVVLTFLAWVPAAMLVGQLQRFGEAEREILRARAETTETELRAVRQQVNSHLVFNGLNSILVAIEEGSPRAAASESDERTRSSGGFGLRATRHRLAQAYGAAAELALSPSTVSGDRRVTATIRWPVPDRVTDSPDGVS
jgi:hypothetical protein